MYQPDASAAVPVPNPYGATPYSTHYPNQYPTATTGIAAATPIPFFTPFHQTAVQVPKPPPPVVEVLPLDPPEPSVTPEVASRALRRLVTFELKNAGFERSVPAAVERLEHEVATFVQQLFQRAHEYGNLANRAGAIPSDVLLACEEFDIPPKELYQVTKTRRRRKRAHSDPNVVPIVLTAPPSRSPSPELLDSDDENAESGTTSNIPSTLRDIPPYFPEFPPKHTYLQTPASPPKKAALPSLEKKLKTAALVQESLQHLLLTTEDTANNEDRELLGHIVNWETSTQPRKRWKVGK